MKKIFTLIAGVMLAATANATAYKNLYAEVEVYPSGAGLVWLTAPKAADEANIYEQADDWSELGWIKITQGEGGDMGQCQGNEGYEVDALGSIGFFDCGICILPEDGYEFVAIVPELVEDGVYDASTAIKRRIGESAGAENPYVFTWEYQMDLDGEGTVELSNRININNPDHPQDGHSNDGPYTSIEETMANAPWSETPDVHYYCVFREVGAELPRLDVNEEDPTAIKVATSEAAKAGIYNLAGQKVGANAKGIVVKDGVKVLK